MLAIWIILLLAWLAIAYFWYKRCNTDDEKATLLHGMSYGMFICLALIKIIYCLIN